MIQGRLGNGSGSAEAAARLERGVDECRHGPRFLLETSQLVGIAGDRRKAERESVRRVARALGNSDLRRWSADEITGFRRMTPMLACIPDLEHWSARDKHLLTRIVRGKGSRRERDYTLLASRHRRFNTAVEHLANQAPPEI